MNYRYSDAPVTMTEKTPPSYIIKRTCLTIAGLVGEQVFDRENLREGSSVDELIMSQVMARFAVNDDGRAENFWRGCWKRTAAILKHNEHVALTLTARLDKQHVVQGKKLKRILADVAQIDPNILDVDDLVAVGAAYRSAP